MMDKYKLLQGDALTMLANAMRAGFSFLQALDLIATKLARIITGDPDYSDNWHDIAGYATLVEQEIARLQQLEAQGAKLAEKIKQHKENQNV